MMIFETDFISLLLLETGVEEELDLFFRRFDSVGSVETSIV